MEFNAGTETDFANRDTDFKLHPGKQTTIIGKVENGKLARWSVEPNSCKNDVVVYKMSSKKVN